MGLSDLSQQCEQITLYRQALFGSPPPTSWPIFSTPTVTEKSKSRQESRPTQSFRTFPAVLRTASPRKESLVNNSRSDADKDSPMQWEGEHPAPRTELDPCSMAVIAPEFFCRALTVDDVVDLLEEENAEPSEPPPPPPLDSLRQAAERGQRLADAAFETSYRTTKSKFESIVRKNISRRVMLPRAQGSMRVKFSMDLAPLHGVQAMCESAGLKMVLGPKRCGSAMKRVWQTDGPAATCRFAQLNKAHPLGWGGAKLTKAPKAAKRKRSRVMTLLAPPLKVTHKFSKDEDWLQISAYLVTYNEEGNLGLPPNHQKIWGEASVSTERALTKYAKKMLGEMFVEQLPVSQTFLRNLGTQYYDSCDEDSDSNWSEGDDN